MGRRTYISGTIPYLSELSEHTVAEYSQSTVLIALCLSRRLNWNSMGLQELGAE